MLDQILNAIKNFIPNRQRPELVSARPQIDLTPTPTPTPKSMFDQLLEGYGRYGATPSAEAVRVMAEAPDKYPVYKENPYLLPAISILETSAGQNITRPKNNPQNLMNWGIYAGYEPQSQAESVERAMTGIGERMPYYEKFRKTNDLADFVNAYAPASDGNEGYLDNLIKAMSYFE